MTHTEYQDLVEFLHHRAGDAFRSAFHYTADDWQTLHVRSDVATEDLQNTIGTLIDRTREHEPIIRGGAYDRLGEPQATVELHANGVLLQFRESDTSGVVVSLDRAAAQDLAGFVDRCQAMLQQ